MRKRNVVRGTAISVGGATGGAGYTKDNIYSKIGVRTFINLTATYTINGGTLLLPEVRQSMDEASRHSVNMDELMEKVGARIARLLGSEAAIVTSGCAASLTHATAACVAGGDPEKLQQLPDLTGLKSEVIMPKPSRNMYDQAIRMAGVRLLTVGTREEFRAALGSRTAMVAVLGIGEPQGPMRLEEIAESAHGIGVPVLVDAAAELPLNPDPYLARGADLVAYSGGKILRGPQCAGLLLGCRELVQAAWVSSAPHHAFGRPMKVGKEEVMGMLAAVEAWAARRDLQAEYRIWEKWLNFIAAQITRLPGVQAKLLPPAGASPFPVLTVTWDPNRVALTAGEMGRQLLAGEPRIMSHAEGDGSSFIIRPVAMQPGQHRAVAARLSEILRQAGRRVSRKRQAARPAPDVCGSWDVRLRFVSGEARHKLSLRAGAAGLEGTHRTRELQGPVQGSVQGERVRFRSSIPCQGVQLVYDFAGKVSGETMAGEVGLGEYGRALWTARRTRS